MKRYGKKVYDGSNTVKCECIGTYICRTCGCESRLIRRKGYGFQNILSVCEEGHTCEVAKELYEKYKVGDRIRLYESTFGKDAVLRLDSYTEGIVINSYPCIIDYEFDFRVDKCVINGNEIKATSWVIGSIHHGVSHSSTKVRLLEKGKKEVYEQLTLNFILAEARNGKTDAFESV